MGLIRFTPKQLEIIKVIKDKRSDGEFCDVYDIMDKLSFEIRRDGLLHSIRLLVNKGYVERLPLINRHGKAVRPFTVTSTGYALV